MIQPQLWLESSKCGNYTLYVWLLLLSLCVLGSLRSDRVASDDDSYQTGAKSLVLCIQVILVKL